MRAAKVLVRLHFCIDWPEPLLLNNLIGTCTKISCAGSIIYYTEPMQLLLEDTSNKKLGPEIQTPKRLT